MNGETQVVITLASNALLAVVLWFRIGSIQGEVRGHSKEIKQIWDFIKQYTGEKGHES